MRHIKKDKEEGKQKYMYQRRRGEKEAEERKKPQIVFLLLLFSRLCLVLDVFLLPVLYH